MRSPEPKSRTDERREMVQQQLAGRGIVDRDVLQAMGEIEREAFLPEDLQNIAYGDHASPIPCGQTISQPYTVAFMLEAAQLTPSDRVLEVGTGSGYAAAVLSRLVTEVHSVERIHKLAVEAAHRLKELGFSVRVHEGDGTLGLPEEAPFDAIIVTAGAKQLPAAYARQLRTGGRIVIPIGSTQQQQRMKRLTWTGDKLQEEDLGSFVFVPLIGADSWSAAQ